jgi:Spy/CpxP family protein refolding chaperone
MNRVIVLRGLGCFALGAALAVVAPVSHALQPEPQMMIESGTGIFASPVAALTSGRFDSPGQAGDQRGDHGMPLLPPFIRLSEQQQDKLFELRHAQEPALRMQLKELRSAHELLRAVAMNENYDETRARQVVARAAQASAEIDLIHARLQHAALALLTFEQRKHLDECQPDAEGMPVRGCPPPPR